MAPAAYEQVTDFCVRTCAQLHHESTDLLFNIAMHHLVLNTDLCIKKLYLGYFLTVIFLITQIHNNAYIIHIE